MRRFLSILQRTASPGKTLFRVPWQQQYRLAASSSATSDNKSSSRLPSEQQNRQNDITKSISKAMDRFTESVFIASQRINDLTGYSEIEKLKKAIQAKEAEVEGLRNQVKQSKQQYQTCIRNSSSQQRQVNELLHRKHAWTPQDLENFTTLYKDQQMNEMEENKLHAQLGECEHLLDDAQTNLSKLILTRYREEQIWSDKIRQASTWGTWMLMGINIVLFIVVQLGLEPWKRKRLVNSFQQVVAQRFDSQMDDIKQLSNSQREQQTDIDSPATPTPTALIDNQDQHDEPTLVQEHQTGEQMDTWSTFLDRLQLLFINNNTTISPAPFFTRDEITLLGLTSATCGAIITFGVCLLVRGH